MATLNIWLETDRVMRRTLTVVSLVSVLSTGLILSDCPTTSAQDDGVLPPGFGPTGIVAVDDAVLGKDPREDAPSPSDRLGPFGRFGLSDPSATHDDCGDGCDHRWTATADALFLLRRNPGELLLAENTQTAGQVVSASDLRSPVQTGWDLTLSRQFCPHTRAEVRFFAVDGWTAASSTPTTTGELLRFNTGTPIFSNSAGTWIDSTANSQLYNLELNGVRQVTDRLSFIAGVRHLQLDEHLSLATVASAAPVALDYVTRNRLWGAQAGGRMQLIDVADRAGASVAGKVGLFGNAAAQDGTYSTGLVTLPAYGSTSVAAMVAELELMSTMRLTSNLTFRAGYRLLWVDGVALAPEQVPATEFVFGTGINATGDSLYHGAVAGLEYQW